jgi:aerobic-type carbon monoxide dehydrogenase small subunit (CoxS/CutS family)
VFPRGCLIERAPFLEGAHSNVALFATLEWVGPKTASGYMILKSVILQATPQSGFSMAAIHLFINNHTYSVDTDPQTSLLTVLRDHLDLTGSKYGCGEGQCGACTVLVNGKAQRSCITKVGSVSEKQITTIEGVAAGDRLHPVQQAFLDEEAMQCAYCTSGMIMSAVSLLTLNHHPTRDEIVDFMEGNICRCGTYPRIVSAIQKAASTLAESQAAKGASR